MIVKIGIIGAGIGGCAAAYYLHQKLPDSEIYIFDKLDRVGGRLYHRQIESITNELGATFFHTVNKNIMKLVTEFNLPVNEYVYPRFGIWNGSEIIFTSSRNSLVTNLKLLFRYRLTALKLNGLIKTAKKRVLELYQPNQPIYTNLKDLFTVGNINEWIGTPFDKLLRSMGISQKFVDEIIEPSTRMIYAQNAGIGSFAGLATLISSDGTPLYKLKEGNSTLAVHLAKKSNAQVKLSTDIQEIKELNGKFTLNYNKSLDDFDAIILAAPLEQAKLTLNFDIPSFEMRFYQRTYFKLISGKANPSYFGKTNVDEIPELLMTQNVSSVPFTVLENLGQLTQGNFLYNLVSTNPITDELVKELFQEIKQEEDHFWEFSYPVSKAIDDYQPIKLYKNFYYINAIESTASTMEASILGAKTVTDLLVHENQS